MNAAEALMALYADTKEWRLTVNREGDDVTFHVSGEVRPVGKQRPVRVFFGPVHHDARDALIAGIATARVVRERITK